MMKKVLVLLLALILITGSFSGCRSKTSLSSQLSDISKIEVNGSQDGSDLTGSSASDSDNDSSDSSKASGASTDANKTSSNTKTVTDNSSEAATPKKPVVNSPAPNSTGVSSNGNTTTEKSNVVVEDIPISSEEDNKKLEEIQSPEVNTEIKVEIQNHVALTSGSYYQYSTLSATEKKIYNAIVEAIGKTQNIISVESYHLSYDETLSILQKAIADYPQYFWLSKSTSITKNAQNNIAYSIILYYTDGVTTDKLSKDLKLENVANRNTISSQISEFNSKVAKILASIPADSSELEKELLIHDYIVSNVTYDTKSAAKSYSYGQTLPHCFDSYGAVCKGLAVCEGYSKMFQYLCYCVGINATQTLGQANGGNHMWNCVKINNDWYHLDATWDDSTDDKLPYYEYFNFTTAMAQKERTIDTSMLSVPSCTVTTCAFYNCYAAIVDSMNAKPSNYQKSADELNKQGNYVIIYLNNHTFSQAYLQTYFFDKNSVYNQYIRSKGYKFTLSSQYITIGQYCYIPINR